MGSNFGYLTMFSVQQLKALYVLQLNALWQRLPLEIDLWELWESSGCIWTQDKGAVDTKREIPLTAQSNQHLCECH